MKHSTINLLKRTVPLTLAFSTLSIGLNAEEVSEEESATLNVVTVTAQKRQENAQDTPISINVLSAEQLSEGNIEKIEDLQFKVPNLQMTETGISTQMFVRGIGTGNNQGFEQSVGQYIDGVYYGRQQLIRAPFLDLERIEVLKGPQSILFGKNSIAGALNMVSAKPSQDFEAKFGVQYQPDFGALETTAVISGGLSENLSARLAVRDYSEDGYIYNSFTDRDEPSKDDLAIRASFLWTPSDDIEILFKAEQDNFDVTGRQIEIIRDDPALAGAPIPGATFAQILGVLGHPGAITETNIDFERQADDDEYGNNKLNNMTLRADFDFDGYTFTSISGLVSYEFEENCDCDYVAAPIFDAYIEEEYDQFSQEFRVISPLTNNFDWVGGVFFQTSELNFDDDIRVPSNSVLGLLSGGALASITGKGAGRRYESDSDLWAVFFQGKFHLSDDLTVTLGARYTREEKTGLRILNITDLDTGQITSDPVAPTLFTAVFGIQNEQLTGHNLSDTRDESSFTPSLNIQYKLDDEIMLYGSATTGFKSGGFDARANNINSWEFEEEEATSIELGMKSSLLDNTLEANVSFYRTQYDNLQVSQFDGVLGFNVGNAKDTLVQGVEIDGRWLIVPELTMNYAIAFLDHEFKDFTNGNCYNRQVPDGDITPSGQLCDYTGKSGQYTPKVTANLSLDYVKPVSWGPFDYFRSSLGMYHSASQNVDVNLDPLYEIDAYTKFNMRFAIESENWSVALIGKNLTDEKILTYVGNTPLSGGTFGTNTFYGFVDRPRSYGVQVSYQY